MNALEIEEAVSNLALQPFDVSEFPFAFLKAFGNKDTTIKKLKSAKNSSNSSDISGGVLQRNNIHIGVCAQGDSNNTLIELKQSPATSKGKVKIILATDGVEFVAEDLNSGETVACAYGDFANHFGFFLSLAGITTTKEIRNNAVDIQATGRLNRLYVELLKENQDWDTAERRHDLNQFMSRLIFCYFAEDTGIFPKEDMFTHAIEQISDSRSENADFVISKIFHAMDVKREDRDKEDLPNWTRDFPYVNGGLFSGNRDVPKFSRIARSYLIHAGNLNWKEINPDIFGSMIQAVADDEERGSIGMHYTSVPNILKVLNPLFLDDLREGLQEAGENHRKLLNLRKRISKIRVFDPACGSGNFLVIAYKEMRQIESEINNRRDESHLRSEIPLSNFRGIELREFATEIARLALIIAEYQCDELYRGQKDALADFLPLDSKNWIVHGNALRIDWLSVCPPTEKVVEHFADDFFHKPQDQSQIDFENEGGETYICGNPPYLGSQDQSSENKEDMRQAFRERLRTVGSTDYVAGWFVKAADFVSHSAGLAAFVTTNSISQGRQVAELWPIILSDDTKIMFAYKSIKWSNLAANKAGVVVNIIGFGKSSKRKVRFFDSLHYREVEKISPYLVPNSGTLVAGASEPISKLPKMVFGNMPNDGGHLLLSWESRKLALEEKNVKADLIKPFLGSKEFIRGEQRFCIWVNKGVEEKASKNAWLKERFDNVRRMRNKSKRKTTNQLAKTSYAFGEVRYFGESRAIIVPSVSSENRHYLPCGYLNTGVIVSNLAFVIPDADIWNLSLLASRLHMVWTGTTCGYLGSSFRYSNTLGWNTFPVPTLTEKNRLDLTRCAVDILSAREKHFPATIADLYDPEKMPENLRQAHEKNDETLERIYIGRRFNNDTERLEKLFELYTKMTSSTNGKETLESAS
ncbi:lactate dehydrogenase [Pseudomonadales bacterium]|nr:lactate dehydrogenase [Pseudomonadales bacterium]